jgi:hypothetical protein
MKKMFLIFMLVLLFVGCENKSNPNIAIIHVEIDSVALKDSIYKVELIKNEGIKAIGNINFYISEKEFEKQKEAFLKPLTYTINVGAAGSYNDGYILGKYRFNYIKGLFFNDSLYTVHVLGYQIEYDNYDTKMQQQYEILLSILTEKYGLPNAKNELPSWSSMSNNENILIARWDLGFKNLFVFVVCSGVYYRLDFCYYVPEMSDRKNELEKEESKNTNQKAAEIL